MPYTIRLRTALVPAAEYYRFADWLLQQPQVGGQLIIDGTSQARAPAVIRTTTSATTVIPSAAPEFKVPSRKGLMGCRQHNAFIDWLNQHCPPKHQALATASGKGSAGTPTRLSYARPKGRLFADELRAFVATVAKRYQLDIRADQFESVREVSGHGLYLKRRRPPVPVPMNLRLEIQERYCEVYYCAPFFHDGSMWTTFTTVQHFENGTITSVESQPDSGPHIYNPDSVGYFSCPSTEIDSDYDPEFDYGTSTGDDTITYSGAVDPSGLLTTALSNLAIAGAATDALDLDWMSDGSPPSYSDVQLGSWSDNAAPYTTRAATSYRYRWISTGPGMHLEWTQGGSAKTLDLAADTTSSWYDDAIAGLTMGDYDFITDLVISF